MHKVTDIYFVGGFGTVQWIDVAEYLSATPDAIATHSPPRTLAVSVRLRASIVRGQPRVRPLCWAWLQWLKVQFVQMRINNSLAMLKTVLLH